MVNWVSLEEDKSETLCDSDSSGEVIGCDRS